MTVLFGSDAGTVFTAGGSGTGTAPTGVSAGDCLIAAAEVYDITTATPTLGTGGGAWNVYRTDSYANSTAQATIRIFWKVATGGDDYSFTVGTTNYTDLYIARYTGAHPTTPLVDTGAFSQGSTAGAITIGGVNVSAAGSLLWCGLFYYNMGNGGGPSAPGTWTNRELDFDGGTLSIYDSPFASTGATGNITGASVTNLGGTLAWGATVAVIAPAPSASQAYGSRLTPGTILLPNGRLGSG